jgi:hypothetical protein
MRGMRKKQMPIGIDPVSRAELESAASTAGRSVAEEVRRRLAKSFLDERYNATTRELADDVMWMADEIDRLSNSASVEIWSTRRPRLVSWADNPNAHAAFAAALRTWLEIIGPKPSVGASALFGPGDPETLGRAVAQGYRRLKAELMKSYEGSKKDKP